MVLLYGFEACLQAMKANRRESFAQLFLRNLSRSTDTTSPVIQQQLVQQQELLRVYHSIRTQHRSFKLKYVDRNDITRMCREDTQHGGVALVCAPRKADATWKYSTLESRTNIDVSSQNNNCLDGTYVLPFELRDPVNFGNMARTCLAFDATILLPDAEKHMKLNCPSSYKISKGALEWVRLVSLNSPSSRGTVLDALSHLKENLNFNIYVASPRNEAPLLPHISLKPTGVSDDDQVRTVSTIGKRNIIVLGNEHEGVHRDIYTLANSTVAIEKWGSAVDSLCTTISLDSLNVNTALSVLLDHFSRPIAS